ncbi:MAG: superoxide dismutase family protein [Planctomycetota bacterium]
MKRSLTLPAAAALGGLLLTVSCSGSRDQGHHPTHPVASTQAVAQLSPTQGHQVKGRVSFTPEDHGVRVYVSLTGLTPGEHGFHVHEKGDCSAPDASSAGAHFEPATAPHGGRLHTQRHVGDLGNLTADAQGRVETSFVDHLIALSGPASIVGRAVIVHAKADDLHSQPSGDAGGRVACGIIELLR